MTGPFRPARSPAWRVGPYPLTPHEARDKLILSRPSPDDRLVTTLYDLQKSPYELHDIAAESPGRVARLIREELRLWLERTGDPFVSQLPVA